MAKRGDMRNDGSDTHQRVNFDIANDSDTLPVDSEHGDGSQPLPIQHQPALNKDNVPPEPPMKEVQFVPNFKGAAEMEARRRLRMMARRGLPASVPKHPSVTPRSINPELSSSDGDDGMLEASDDNDDDFELVAPGDDNMDEADEFDPYGALYVVLMKGLPSYRDFAATRMSGVHSGSASDGISILSGTASALSVSGLGTPPFLGPYPHTRSRLSPVSEHRTSDEVHEGSLPTLHSKPIETYFEMISPVPKPNQNQRPEVLPQRQETRRRGMSISQPVIDTPSDMTFTRKSVTPARRQASALTAILASSGGTTNPFSELYGSISGRGETASMDVKVFFPHAKEPRSESMTLNVRKDATIEEVIGFALWTYWDEGWLPELNENAKDDDPRLSAIGWVMRIAEDDGEVDEDFPRMFKFFTQRGEIHSFVHST